MAVFASLSSAAARFAAALLLAALVTGVQARGSIGDETGQPAREATITRTELPVQGQRTYEAILKGGPFRYEKDGAVFGNRERLLPRERRGHYREYTVETPGSRDRGARRIVCAGERAAPSACWYTADHYASFRRIVP
jgi:ribonuclease T1